MKNGAKNSEVLNKENLLWAYPEVGLTIGQKIMLGESEFRVDDVIEDDSTQTFRMASFAPKIYIGLNRLEQTRLIRKGATFSETYLYRFTSDVNVKETAKLIFKAIPDPGVQVTTASEAGEDAARVLSYLSDYLGLVSLMPSTSWLMAVGWSPAGGKGWNSWKGEPSKLTNSPLRSSVSLSAPGMTFKASCMGSSLGSAAKLLRCETRQVSADPQFSTCPC